MPAKKPRRKTNKPPSPPPDRTEVPTTPPTAEWIAARLDLAARALDDFTFQVREHFDKVKGGFESPPPVAADGRPSERCDDAWETPEVLYRAVLEITEVLFGVGAREVNEGPLRRGMDGRWLAGGTWTCDAPYAALTDELVKLGRGIIEKKAEVQRGFERVGLTHKWVSDSTMYWAESTGKSLVRKASLIRPRPAGDPDGARNALSLHKPAGLTCGELLAQANIDEEVLSPTSFVKVRNAAGFKPAPRGGGGAQRRFSRADLRRLIVAARKVLRKGEKIAAAWELLLSPGS